jgi:hypothetical protein
MDDPQRYHKIQAASFAFVQHDTRDHVLHIAHVPGHKFEREVTHD